MRTPLIVCVRCSAPLNPREEYEGALPFPLSVIPDVTGQFRGVSYLHPPRVQPWDHDPEPGVAGGPVATVCDFCASPAPVHLWLTGDGTQIRVTTPESNDVSDLGASPWAACQACSALVSAQSLPMLVARYRANALPSTGMNRQDRDVAEAMVTEIFGAFLGSHPRGPFKFGAPG